MTATGHALIGALIAAKFHNPYLAIPLSFASHFAADMVPHWDAGTHHREKSHKQLFKESAVDVVVGVVTSFVLYNYILGESNYVLLYACVFASQLPDWMTAPYFIFNQRSKFFEWSKWSYKVQHKLNSRLDLPWGAVTQVVAVIALYILLFRVF